MKFEIIIDRPEKGKNDEYIRSSIFHVIPKIADDFNLNLKGLTQIIITQSLEKQLHKISDMNGINKITYTNEVDVKTIGKFLCIRNKNDHEIFIFLNYYEVEKHLFSQEESTREFLAHVIHHELAHIHDINQKITFKKKENFEKLTTDKLRYIYPLVENCWSEYYANFLSQPTATEKNYNFYISLFMNELKKSQDNFSKDIIRFRIHGDIDKLLDDFNRRGSLLIRLASYNIGYIDGLNTKIDFYCKELYEQLKQSCFCDIFLDLSNALSTIRKSYPSCDDELKLFIPLIEVVEKYFNLSGLFFSKTMEDKIYISVPISKDTVPY